jgi:hypothetical protein
MILGVSYNVFDGEELLEYSIKSIRDNVDYISVVYQITSNHGQTCNEGLIPLLNKLLDDNLVDELYLFTPDLIGGENASMNELQKRNIGLELSRKHGCTHHMSMDSDEFYTNEQFIFMKNSMTDNFDVAVCQHCQYYKDSIYILKNKEQEYVTTIQKIHQDTQYVYMIDAPVSVDPTRKTNNKNYKIFNRSEVEMHHMSFVRKNIKNKLMNSSSRRFFTDGQINTINNYYNNWTFPEPAMWAGGNLLEVMEIPRIFNIFNINDNS